MASHYELLGIKEDASRREVNAAYRRLAKTHHPDRGGDPAKFQQITEAYTILKNKPERDAYDFEHKFGSYLDETANRRGLRQRLAAFLQARAFAALSVFSFIAGVLLIDAGDGIHENLSPVLLTLGSVAVLMSVGFFANRGRPWLGLEEACLRGVLSILFFLFDLVMRVYVIFALAFSVVALVALLNWLKKTYLHFLPLHF